MEHLHGIHQNQPSTEITAEWIYVVVQSGSALLHKVT